MAMDRAPPRLGQGLLLDELQEDRTGLIMMILQQLHRFTASCAFPVKPLTESLVHFLDFHAPLYPN